jgi:hypothetical protein
MHPTFQLANGNPIVGCIARIDCQEIRENKLCRDAVSMRGQTSDLLLLAWSGAYTQEFA